MVRCVCGHVRGGGRNMCVCEECEGRGGEGRGVRRDMRGGEGGEE